MRRTAMMKMFKRKLHGESEGYPLKRQEAADFYAQSENIRRRMTNILDESGYPIKNLDDRDKLETGDIVLLKSRGPISWIIRQLIKKNYSVPFKPTLSHIQVFMESGQCLSAEPRGVKRVDMNRLKKGTEVIIYRMRNMTPEKKKMLLAISGEYLGKKYSYARYLLTLSRIGRFYQGMTAWCLYIAGVVLDWAALKWHALGFGVFYGLFRLSEIVWKRLDKKCYDCTEVVSEILTRMGCWIPLEKPGIEHPNGMKHVLENKCQDGTAKLLAEFIVE